MTTRPDSTDPRALIEVVRVLEGLLRATEIANAEEMAGLTADAATLGGALDAYRAQLAEVAEAGLDADATPATLTRAVAAALAATDLDAAVRALRETTTPVAEGVAGAALRVRVSLALRLCAAALAGLAGREAP